MASVVFILSQSYLLNAYFVIKLYPEIKQNLIYGFAKILTALLITSLTSVLYNQLFDVNNVLQLILGAIIVVGITIPIIVFSLFKIIDRNIMMNYLMLNINRILKR